MPAKIAGWVRASGAKTTIATTTTRTAAETSIWLARIAVAAARDRGRDGARRSPADMDSGYRGGRSDPRSQKGWGQNGGGPDSELPAFAVRC
ncbi:hypothetical protein GCM10009840_21840 [Pseudolysinimonas kribbensis]